MSDERLIAALEHMRVVGAGWVTEAAYERLIDLAIASKRRRHLADQMDADFLDDDEFAVVAKGHRLAVEAEDAALARLTALLVGGREESAS